MPAKKKDPAQTQEKPIPNPLWEATFDQAALAQNVLKIIPLWQEALALAAKITQKKGEDDKPADPFGLRHVFAALLEDMTKNPARYLELQQLFWSEWMTAYQHAMQELLEGSKHKPSEAVQDKRFKNQAWVHHPFFEFLRKSYGILSKTLLKAVNESETMPPRVKAKLEFFTRQIVDALSPTNNPLTNPDVLEEIAKTHGENLIKGLSNLVEDLKHTKNTWTVSSAPKNAFKIGKDLAATKGSVVYRNRLMELIQYAPSTTKVQKTPLLIIPPWINKYYILDLRQENSLVKWIVDQGHTVFLISWRNPDESFKNVMFDDYMKAGIIESINAIERITGEKHIHAMGYCIGGTLLAMTLCWLKATKQDKWIKTATFLTTLIDFKEAGDLSIFIDEDQLQNIESMIGDQGYLDGEAMKATFALLRANDLIWSYVVNNYWLGRDPQAFDMLAWNSDTTNLPAAFHLDYLRSMYIANRLATAGAYKIGGVPVDITKIDTPSYFLSAKDDHIAPWKATYRGMRMFSGPHMFTLAGSGHVAGIVNPPQNKKYGYWASTKAFPSSQEWLKDAAHHEGSWWPHWHRWASKDAKMVTARQPGKGLGPAPGPYVRGETP